MKYALLVSLAALQLSLFSLSWAMERPEMTFGFEGRHTGLLGVYEPVLKWTHGGRVFGCDYAAGVDVTASQGEKIAEYSVFGRIKRSLYGWNFKARLDTSSDHLQSVDTYFHMEGGPCKTWLTVRGNVASDLTACRLTDIGIAQPLNLRGQIADLSTKYDMDRNLAECVVSYSVRDGSVITLGADSGNKQLLSISQRIGKHHELTPTVSTKGDMELEYKLNTDGDGVLSTNYNPKNALTLKYERWPWKSDFKIPVRDFYKVQQGARFSVRRSLESFAQM